MLMGSSWKNGSGKEYAIHAQIKNISSVESRFFLSTTYFTEERTDLPREAMGPITSRGGFVPIFLRKHIAA